VKLLFDENLSPRLVESIANLYTGSLHVRDCGLRGASDDEVWRFALQNGFAIVAKDSDFRHKSNLFGSPPKVIWLQIGNCTTSRAEFILINKVTRIQDFLLRGEESCLVLKHPA
jgi:predicted nuclease of predicted toxin-antitoxin system